MHGVRKYFYSKKQGHEYESLNLNKTKTIVVLFPTNE